MTSRRTGGPKPPKPPAYPYIRAWGKMMGSFKPYIDEQIAAAREANAPLDAVYFNGNNWVRFTDVQSDETRARVRGYL